MNKTACGATISLIFIFISGPFAGHHSPIQQVAPRIYINQAETEDNNQPETTVINDSLLIAADSIGAPQDSADTGETAEEKIKKPWPTGALLRSAIMPGWGQFYNKQYLKTIIYGGAEILLAYKARQNWREMDEHQSNFMNSDDPEYKAREFALYEDKRDTRNLYLWLTGLSIFISMFDAYVDAHMADFDRQDKAFEVYLDPETDKIRITIAYNF
jgi:hypothetical protein